jgi:excisionase family DNA binding protein
VEMQPSDASAKSKGQSERQRRNDVDVDDLRELPVYISIKEAAKTMSVSEKTIRRWIAAGKIAAFTLGGPRGRLIRIASKDLEGLLHRIPTAGDW